MSTRAPKRRITHSSHRRSISNASTSKKPKLTLEQTAHYLVVDAEIAAMRYYQAYGTVFPYLYGNADDDSENVTILTALKLETINAFVYAYIFASLRTTFEHFTANDVVGEAMKQRFGMSNEDFAIDILGG